ncbi:TolC family protein [Hymenobacter crusticola]|uniref:Transporter n=1 Tax=Hymenobacter crusticola TaxID=1770526 RepID=A0A243W8X7_9BACT|nr:TolC family protein [Hymenobacter crusticola]OUJ71833.1 hypothetical protein BXP70_21010 [Hymenobacter crusticola]
MNTTLSRLRARSSTLLLGILLLMPWLSWAQKSTQPIGSLPPQATLQQCIEFALNNQPAVRQARLNEQIGERNIRIGLSYWLPQINGTGIYTRNIQLPTSVLPNFTDPSAGQQIIRIGLKNTSTVGVGATQLLFNNDVLLAARSVRATRLNYAQTTALNKIDVVTNVSKAFYDILLTQEQLRILLEDIQRQERQVKDARAQYEQGIVDKTDFLRAEISVKNAYAQRRSVSTSMSGKYATLKQLMGLAPENPLNLTYDTLQMVKETALDTTQRLAYEKRVEIQQLQTQKQLQRFQIDYYRFGFLPSLSGFYNYNRVYQNNNFSDLYSRAFPNQNAGVQLALPIFTGTRRLQNLKIAELQDDQLDLSLFDTRNQINTEFEQTMGAYKGALNELAVVQQNVADAKEVYRILNLQYREGIRTFLDVIIAETDLRTAQLNYYNALFSVLSSKLDVERALGNITFNQ